jgi:hypothetical protein
MNAALPKSEPVLFLFVTFGPVHAWLAYHTGASSLVFGSMLLKAVALINQVNIT